MKPIWDAEKAAAKAKANREELISLAHATGSPVMSHFVVFFSSGLPLIYAV